jgi:hypothetical protein
MYTIKGFLLYKVESRPRTTPALRAYKNRQQLFTIAFNNSLQKWTRAFYNALHDNSLHHGNRQYIIQGYLLYELATSEWLAHFVTFLVLLFKYPNLVMSSLLNTALGSPADVYFPFESHPVSHPGFLNQTYVFG